MFKNKVLVLLFISFIFSLTSCKKEEEKKQSVFPQFLPKEKPNMKLSKAVNRLYDNYTAVKPQENELFSQFKYTEIKGFDYNNHDGTITRRDPSKIIFNAGKYYVWYTYRNTSTPPQGAEKSNDTIPSADWDLSEIWYATSKNGFTWEEQGVAIKRPEKPFVGWRSVSTADILVWKGKYYLYYQGFKQASGKRGDDCPVAVSFADSPNGPWTPYNKEVIPNGEKGSWDQFSIHDPYPLVYKGKIYLYYKSDFGKTTDWIRMQGLATANNPLGPFTKHPLNPVMSSGHETTLFPFKQGIAALAYKDGNEHNTIQFSEDGVNFEIASITELMPIAGAPYIADAFTDTKDGRGITWGLSHFIGMGGRGKWHSKLVRFDCDLSLDINDSQMKKSTVYHSPEVYMKQGLNKTQLKRIEEENKKLNLDK
ncbi:glycoside hydrolase family 117 protein [Polaribacter sp. SA4-12]|uniref:glycoside hydrolase family 117 protein n=1 Tax=Polaribacter sp. SA4-12 TaxID=1312072 RepID=UPI000B584AD5|nr:glycoside hydrolase [Polaribacter sp. SA4-12]ARV16570.1 glycoside hydrolase [Polaribacter sp. SA4-12]